MLSKRVKEIKSDRLDGGIVLTKDIVRKCAFVNDEQEAGTCEMNMVVCASACEVH